MSRFALQHGLQSALYGWNRSIDAILLSLGSNLLHWWEPRFGLVTENSGNVAEIAALMGGANETQATSGNQPLWVNDGSGPGGRPFITYQDINRRLAAAVSYALGNRHGVYVIAKHGGSGSFREVLNIGTSVTDDVRFAETTGPAFYMLGLTGPQAFAITSPSFDTGWHLRSYRPLSTGARSEIDAALTTPNFTGSNASENYDRVTMGSRGASAAGSLAATIITAEPTTAIDDVVRAYSMAQFKVAA